MSNTDFDIPVAVVEGINGGCGQSLVCLKTVNPDEYVNLILERNGLLHSCTTLPVVTAMELRDALIEMYPPRCVSETWPQPPEYRVEPGFLKHEWSVFKVEPNASDKRSFVCTVDTEENAQRIAQAMNQMEGL